MLPDFINVIDAYKRIKDVINRTPVMTSRSLNDMFGCELFFKCENFQRVGAFKFRGAANAVLSLIEQDNLKAVATHSSGNHAQALALAAKMNNVHAYVVMPSNSPQVKKDAVAGYGANITFCEPTLQARESTLEKIIEQTGAVFIHPYDNFDVISGQGTAAYELLDEIENLDYIITPVGGGGLLSGTLITAKELSPDTKVIAAEPLGADDAFRSLQSGKLQPSLNPDTICDGLLTSLSEMTFEIIYNNVHRIMKVSDEAVINAMRLIWERMKIIVEPSAAIVLGAVLENKIVFNNKRIGLILSGGNVDLSNLPWNNNVG
jgi:threonine dehydratase